MNLQRCIYTKCPVLNAYESEKLDIEKIVSDLVMNPAALITINEKIKRA